MLGSGVPLFHTQSYSVSTMNNDFYVNINDVAKAKGLTSNRALRLEINKPNSKYIARKVKVNGGETYEILYSTLEADVQEILSQMYSGTTALVPANCQPQNFESESAKITALARCDIVKAALNFRSKYRTNKEADAVFLELFNLGQYLPKLHNYVGNISIGTLHRWISKYKQSESAEVLAPNYKYSKAMEYNTILDDTMQKVLLSFLLHPHRLKLGKAIKLTKAYLKIKCGYQDLPCDLTFKRFAEHFKNTHFDLWTYARDGKKAYHDNVEAYLERDISKIEVGDIFVADGHKLNFQVLDPLTGKPARATLVGFLDWKSTALVGYEIMMSENTQCIASALRNAIINLDLIPKVVYQDNGKAFKSRFFQNCDFEEEGFNGVYANLGVHSVFAKPYNARSKVIERFFLEFQEEFEKGMASYTGVSIIDKPACMNRGEYLHRKLHEKITQNYVPTIEEAIKYINSWIEFHNSQPCPNVPDMTIKEVLSKAEKQHIPIELLNDLMMETQQRTINKHGITFLNMHYRHDMLLGLRDKVNIKYSLFDLTKIYVYSTKGEFLCVADRVAKVHPMARVLGTVKDYNEYKEQYVKQQQRLKRVEKMVKEIYPAEALEVLEIERNNPPVEIEEFKEPKKKREHKLTPREEQMKKPLFENNYEKFEWLMKNGCTNKEDRKWLADYIRSDEYITIYGDDL